MKEIPKELKIGDYLTIGKLYKIDGDDYYVWDRTDGISLVATRDECIPTDEKYTIPSTDGREELEKDVKGLLFRVAPTPYQDPTIFYIKDVKDGEVDVAWQDIHGRGERITKYVLSDVQNKLKFGTWIKVDAIAEITALQSSLKEKEKEIEKGNQAIKENCELRQENERLKEDAAAYRAMKDAIKILYPKANP